MLKKLLKYELPKIFKFLCIFYGLALVCSLLARLFLGIENSLFALIIGEIFRGAAYSMIISILINNSMRLWVLFRQNLYGDESYLTHTLPIPRKTLYASKMLTVLITMFVSLLVILLSLLILFYSDSLIEMIRSLLSLPDVPAFGMIAGVVLLLFAEFINILQCGFTGLIVGHKRPNKKIGLSVLFGFASFGIGQAVLLIVLGLIALFNSAFMQIFISNQMPSSRTFLLVIWICTAVYGLVVAVFWMCNTRLLKKGVDVE